jgi:hypothetical protein
VIGQPPPLFDRLVAMTDERGLFEHANLTAPRLEHGYCTDDNARMLVVTAREADHGAPAALSRIALSFVLRAQTADGRTRNRMNAVGEWTDEATTDDCWGRSLWAFGVAATHHDDPAIRAAALAAFTAGAHHRSRWPRTMAFAALGAADVLSADVNHGGARRLLHFAVRTIGAPAAPPWLWPQPRLAYANAVLAEAAIAAGAVLGEPAMLDRGLTMLSWLLDLESVGGHLSVTGTAGRGPIDSGPQFDQQPIEVATLADACWRAYSVTGQERWRDGIALAAGWFAGHNDTGTVMWDDATGGGYDGLLAAGVNLNQGAESTLAFISTTQRARTWARITT